MTAQVVDARNAWQAEADRRWPDGPDMVEPAIGSGPFATVAWCGPLTVHLHRTREEAEQALAGLERIGCGHPCWGDHELVDLTEPEAIDPGVEWRRGGQRAIHLRQCWSCHDWSPQGSRTALARALARERRADVP